MVFVLKRDDWALTCKELMSQRVQLSLQLAVVTAGIGHCEKMIKSFPEEKKVERVKNCTSDY